MNGTRLPTRVAIFHRSTFIREVLRLLGEDRGLRVVADAPTSVAVVEVCRAEEPEVVLIEGVFEDGTEVEEVLAGVLCTGARVAVVSDDPSPERLTRILALGATGFLSHELSPVEMVDALLTLAGGALVLDPVAAATVLEYWRRSRQVPGNGGGQRPAGFRAALTRRETEILAAMAEGLSAKAIARQLGIARKTVENHKIRIFDKLEVRNHAEAVCVALAHGLLVPHAGPDAVRRDAPPVGRWASSPGSDSA